MKATKPFRNAGKDIYSEERKASKKPLLTQKEKKSKKRFIEDYIDDDYDLELDYKKRESIEDYFADEEEEDFD